MFYLSFNLNFFSSFIKSFTSDLIKMMRAIIAFKVLWLLLHTILLQGNFLVAQMIKNLPAMWETWIDPWKRDCLHTPIFLPADFHGQRSLAGYSPWGCKQLDTAEQLSIFHPTPRFPSPLGHRLLQIHALLGTRLYNEGEG